MTRWVRLGAISVVLVLGALAAAVVLGAVSTSPPSDDATSAARVAPPTEGPTEAAAPGARHDTALVVPAGDQPVPTRVRIPSIDVTSSLDALPTDRSGALEAPPRWQTAGWFSDGVRPGDTGPAVIAGHIDSPTGPAVFARLSEVRPGDLIDVDQRGGTTVRFRVDRTQVAGKRDFPTQAVYGPTPDAQLRLITCKGPYVESSGGYQDNLIVFATEVSP